MCNQDSKQIIWETLTFLQRRCSRSRTLTLIGVNNMFAPIVVNHLMVTTVRIVDILKYFINERMNLLYIKDMSKKTKDSMAARQHMDAAANAAIAFYKEDDENRAVFQILVERKDEKDPGGTGSLCLGYGNLLILGIINAIDNCEGFRNSLMVALRMKNPLIGLLIAKMLNIKEEE